MPYRRLMLPQTSIVACSMTAKTTKKILFFKFHHKEKKTKVLQSTITVQYFFYTIILLQLLNKIYNTNMHNNSKRWLANYLPGRNAYVNFNGIPSKIRPFRDEVPQGSVLLSNTVQPFSLRHPNTHLSRHQNLILCRRHHRHIHPC